MRTVELSGHVFVIGFSLAIAIAGLALGLYNAGPTLCWIAPYLTGCTHATTTDCTRGQNADLYRLYMHYGIVWINIFLHNDATIFL